MALVLSVREGEDFYVEDVRVVVEKVVGNEEVILRTPDGKLHHATLTKAAEVLPDVMISADDRRSGAMGRLVIEAPREKLILTGDKWRASAHAW